MVRIKQRKSWDEYFLEVTDVIGKRGTCDRGRSGSIVVVNRRIVATGYVGAPQGMPHCDEVGHLMRKVIDDNGNESMHCVRTIHAEENAILQAAQYGVSVRGGTVYCKMTPCFNCAKMMVQVGIVRVVAMKRYHAEGLSVALFRDAGIQLEVVENKLEEY